MMQTDFPTSRDFSREELKERFCLIKDTPSGNPDSAYTIMIPKGWENETLRNDTDTNAPKLLRSFRSPGTNPFIRIHAIRLLRDITAANWLRHHAIETGCEIRAIMPVSDRFADCLMVFPFSGQMFAARAAASVDGDRLFFLLGAAPGPIYREHRKNFGVAVTSFEVLKKSEKQGIENRIRYDSAMLRFVCPASWKCRTVKKEYPEADAADLLSYDPDGNISGRIRVKSVRKDLSENPETLIPKILAEYRDHNVIVTEDRLMEIIRPEIGAVRFESAVARVYGTQTEDYKIGQEVWIAVIGDRNNFITVSMLTPFREKSFYPWAINRRAYGIVLGSLT